MAEPKAAAGWYEVGNQLRYWDGERWTNDRPASPAAGKKRSNSASTAAVGTFALVVGLIAAVFALSVPHSASEVLLTGGAYIKPGHYLALLIGAIVTVILGITCVVASMASRSNTPPAITIITVMCAVLTLGFTALVYVAYTNKDDETTSAPAVEPDY